MTALDDLSPDRRAVLQLLLDQGRGYGELASMLRIDEGVVRDRAHDALQRLSPPPQGLSAAGAAAVADYLLGQQTASERAAARDLLGADAPARQWAWALAGQLNEGGIGVGALPEIPADVAEVDEARDALDARRDAQRRHRGRSKAGAALIAVAALAVAALVIVLISTGGGSDDGGATATATTTATTAPVGVLAQARMASAGGGATAVVQVVRQGATLAMIFRGDGIPRHGERSVYAIWLTGAAGPRRLGFVKDQAKADGTLDFVGALPEPLTLARYGRVLMTRETTPDPSRPGAVVLSGALVVPAAAHSAS